VYVNKIIVESGLTHAHVAEIPSARLEAISPIAANKLADLD